MGEKLTKAGDILLFYVCDEGPNRFYPSLSEAMSDAEEQISIHRKEAYYDGEWSMSVEDICIYACDTETEEPSEDGVLIAQSKARVTAVDENGEEQFEFDMAAPAGRAALSREEGR